MPVVDPDPPPIPIPKLQQARPFGAFPGSGSGSRDRDRDRGSFRFASGWQTPYGASASSRTDGCTVSSGFLLVETAPGREGSVLDALARMPGVRQRHLLFPGALAVKIEASEMDPLAARLRCLEGVTGTRLYRTRFN